MEGLKSGRLQELPDIETIEKQLDPRQHEVFNTSSNGGRPDKQVRDDDGNVIRTEKVARIAVALQQLIVKRAASFTFGNPVKIIVDGTQTNVSNAVERILRDNKTNSLNRKMARILFSCTEVAEYWYPVETKTKFSTYGFETDTKIKCALFSPLKGDKLYPFFSETGDMVAFSREYIIKEGDKDVTYFETWTDSEYTRLREADGGWVEDMDGVERNIELGKIPIIYGSQEETEFDIVQILIERLEKLLSNFADTNDYFSFPKFFTTGQILGWGTKGETGTVIEGEAGATAEVISWDHAPEAIKLEIDTLLRLIYTLTQTPDISFDSMKGLGALSGVALKMMFLDAHLKVQDKMEIFDDYLQRRLNLLKSFVGVLNKSWAKEAEMVEMSAQITPYMVNDERDAIDNIITATSGGIMSRETGISQNPLIDDHQQELERIKAEKLAQESDPDELDNQQNEAA